MGWFRHNPLASVLASGPLPGSPMYERDASIRPALERNGLRFQYWFYRADDGSALWIRQIRELGGPFPSLASGLHAVYQGERQGVRITVGLQALGDIDSREEAPAAIFTFPGRTLPSAHAIEETALDFTAKESGCVVETVENHLLILHGRSSEFLSAGEITEFVEKAIRIAESVQKQTIAAPDHATDRFAAHTRALPPDCGITVRSLTAGDEFRFRIRPTLGATSWSIGFLVLLAAISVAFIRFDLAVCAGPFLLFGLLLLYTTVDYLAGVSQVVVNTVEIRVKRNWFGLGRSYAAADVESIELVPQGPDRRTFAIAVRLRSGASKTLAHFIGEPEHAEIAVAKMLRDLGRPVYRTLGEKVP